MAPLAQTLALLAMAVVATAAMDTLPLDMAWDSFDDQYLQCSAEISEDLPELQSSDFLENPKFEEYWEQAEAEWFKRGSDPSPLTPDEAVALMAYTMMDTKLYEEFNMAVREAGTDIETYQNEFHFKSLHFLLTRALQKLRPAKCQDVSRTVFRYRFEVKKGNEVRFGYFPLSGDRKDVYYSLAFDTEFKVRTCHGADIQKFSYYPWQKEVLIPPFETFRVTDVREERGMKYIELKSTGTSSNYNCAWLEVRSLIWKIPDLPRNFPDFPRNYPDLPSNSARLPTSSPHLGGLLLATVAMAVVTGTL